VYGVLRVYLNKVRCVWCVKGVFYSPGPLSLSSQGVDSDVRY
jgi:hypothetical protein